MNALKSALYCEPVLFFKKIGLLLFLCFFHFSSIQSSKIKIAVFLSNGSIIFKEDFQKSKSSLFEFPGLTETESLQDVSFQEESGRYVFGVIGNSKTSQMNIRVLDSKTRNVKEIDLESLSFSSNVTSNENITNFEYFVVKVGRNSSSSNNNNSETNSSDLGIINGSYYVGNGSDVGSNITEKKKGGFIYQSLGNYFLCENYDVATNTFVENCTIIDSNPSGLDGGYKITGVTQINKGNGDSFALSIANVNVSKIDLLHSVGDVSFVLIFNTSKMSFCCLSSSYMSEIEETYSFDDAIVFHGIDNTEEERLGILNVSKFECTPEYGVNDPDPELGEYVKCFMTNTPDYFCRKRKCDFHTYVPESFQPEDGYNYLCLSEYGKAKFYKGNIIDTDICSDEQVYEQSLDLPDGLTIVKFHYVIMSDDETLIKVCDYKGNCEIDGEELIVKTEQSYTGLIVSMIFIFLFVLLLLCIGVILFLVFLVWKFGFFRKFEESAVEIKFANAEKPLNGTPNLKINEELFEIKFENIKIIKKIAKGGSNSNVYLAEWSKTKVAFKCFILSEWETEELYKEFEKEVEIMASISHPNILVFYGATLKPPRVGIVMEYCENGHIQEYLRTYHKINHEKYPLEKKIKFIYDIALGMEYLHSRKIIHRDLKPQNVLLNENYQIKIIDFGASRSKSGNDKTIRIGTSAYMAPEVVTNNNYDEKCDVFSFAILSFVIVGEIEPYGDTKSEFNLEFKVAQDEYFRPIIERLRLTKEYDWLKDLMEVCWSHNPKNRYNFWKIVKIIEESN